MQVYASLPVVRRETNGVRGILVLAIALMTFLHSSNAFATSPPSPVSTDAEIAGPNGETLRLHYTYDPTTLGTLLRISGDFALRTVIYGDNLSIQEDFETTLPGSQNHVVSPDFAAADKADYRAEEIEVYSKKDTLWIAADTDKCDDGNSKNGDGCSLKGGRWYHDFGANYGDLTYDFSLTCKDENSADCVDANEARNDYPVWENIANILATGIDVSDVATWSTLHQNSHTNRFRAYYANGPNGECDEKNVSWEWDSFCIRPDRGLDNHIVAHEIGHNVHRRALDYKGSLTDGYCDDGYNFYTADDEKCAVAEGWADFWAAATFWEKHAQDAYLSKFAWDRDLDLKAGACADSNDKGYCVCWDYPSSTHRRLGNATRYFWDLYDSTTTWDRIETEDEDLYEIVQNWNDFPAGTGNGENDEYGPNGRNVWDFYNHFLAFANDDAVYENCLEDQEQQ